MLCHACGATNVDSDLRCARCGASLVGYSISTPEDFAKKAAPLHDVLYGRIGATFGGGFVLFLAVFFIPELFENYVALGVVLAVGAAVGRYLGRTYAAAQ